MLQERIAWIVAVALVGGAAFFGGQQLGFQSGQQSRAQAAQQFFAQRGGGPGGPGGQGEQAGAGRGQNIAGVVDSVSGNTIVVTTVDGSKVNVALADGGTVRKQVDGQVGDIKPGERVVAIGALSGDTFQATVLQLGAGRPGAGAGQGAP
jgi:hypothetical protein